MTSTPQPLDIYALTFPDPSAARYVFTGFLPPLAATGVNVGKAGRAYPVQWQLQDSSGAYVSRLSAVYELFVNLDDGTVHQADFQLR